MSHTAMKGCIVKTLNGINCYANHKLTLKEAEFAKNRLLNFRFVGLLEEWNESLKDFIWLNYPTSSILAKYSSGINNITLDEMLTSVHRSGNHVLVQEIKNHVEYHDPYDGLLYKVAKEISSQQRKLRLEGKDKGRNASPC